MKNKQRMGKMRMSIHDDGRKVYDCKAEDFEELEKGFMKIRMKYKG